MNKNSKIFVAGHRGLVGSALVRKLTEQGYKNLLLRNHQELDLMDQVATANFFTREKPEYVFLAAAKVGGILANSTYPAEFVYNNLAIQNNVIHNSWLHGVTRLLFLGSSCIYPKESPQPIKEEYLLSGPLELTNRPYALAKISGVEMCWSYNRQYGTNFFAAMPTNLYGPNDNYDLNTSHVIPALIRKFHAAKISHSRVVEIWGTGKPLREFLHSDDMADACIHLMNLKDEELSRLRSVENPPLINIGSGEEITISHLAYLISEIIGFEGDIVMNSDKPDGTYRKLLDSSLLNELGWKAKIRLNDGLKQAYVAFCGTNGDSFR